jgi:hypothetical protein
LKVCNKGSKEIFKKKLASETKFKYTDKLFTINVNPSDSAAQDTNIRSFVQFVNSHPDVKNAQNFVHRSQEILLKIDKQKKIEVAKSIKQYKRCIFLYEEMYRPLSKKADTSGTNFIDTFTEEQATEIVEIHRKLLPEDFKDSVYA